MRRVAIGLLSILAVATLMLGAGWFYEQQAELKDASLPASGIFVRVGDRRLHVECSGEGAPTVVLEASGLGTARQYQNVIRGLAQNTRVCAYDRAGMGWSEASENPLTAQTLVEDLSGLLRAAHLPPPYILVGSSAGGLPVELYAREHSEQVAGVVFLDALYGEALEKIPDLALLKQLTCPMKMAAQFGLLRLWDPFQLEKMGIEGHRTAALTYQPKPWGSVCSLVKSFPVSAHQIGEAPPLRADLPLAVAVHGKVGDIVPDRRMSTQIEPVWQELQRALAHRSTRGKLVVARQSGHLIAVHQPELVVQLVQEMIASSRK